MNKQPEKVESNRVSSRSGKSWETDKARQAGGEDLPMPEAESSEKMALNGVSPKSPQITGDGEGRQTTKESAAQAASAGQRKPAGSADGSHGRVTGRDEDAG